MECSNHAIKNYGKALHKIKIDTTIPTAGRKLLTSEKIRNLQKMAQGTLYRNKSGNVESLKLELMNGLYHIFNEHSNCQVNRARPTNICKFYTILVLSFIFKVIKLHICLYITYSDAYVFF